MARSAAGFRATPRPKEGKIDLLFIDGPHTASRLVIDAKDASTIAGITLGAAMRTYELSDKSPAPPIQSGEETSSFVVRCSGYSIGPGRQA